MTSSICYFNIHYKNSFTARPSPTLSVVCINGLSQVIQISVFSIIMLSVHSDSWQCQWPLTVGRCRLTVSVVSNSVGVSEQCQ